MSCSSPGKVEFMHILLLAPCGRAQETRAGITRSSGCWLSDGRAVTEEGTRNRKSSIRTRRKVTRDNVGWPVRTQLSSWVALGSLLNLSVPETLHL